jgi:peptide deformylase
VAVREILRMGDARLLRIAAPVPPAEIGTPRFASLLEDLLDTMAHAGGVGLAAPQIAEDQQVVVFGFEESARYPEAPPVPRTILVNPVIDVLTDEEDLAWEGCLSVPGLRGVVPRATRIRYRGLDETGSVIDREVEGFHARVVQHECDHLIGRLYPTRMRDLTRFGFTDVLFPGVETAPD